MQALHGGSGIYADVQEFGPYIRVFNRLVGSYCRIAYLAYQNRLNNRDKWGHYMGFQNLSEGLQNLVK